MVTMIEFNMVSVPNILPANDHSFEYCWPIINNTYFAEFVSIIWYHSPDFLKHAVQCTFNEDFLDFGCTDPMNPGEDNQTYNFLVFVVSKWLLYVFSYAIERLCTSEHFLQISDNSSELWTWVASLQLPHMIMILQKISSIHYQIMRE